MNQAKYEAALKLNAQENSINLLKEQIAAVRAVLANAEAALEVAHISLAENRETVARLPD